VALTAAELDVARMHPVWGVELLANIEFPWDLKPIIRWHHEHCDGSGYPDRLKGDEIPVAAQVVGIVEAYDTLVTGRFDQPPLTPAEALDRITACRHWWSERVVAAFRQAVRPAGEVSGGTPPPG